LYRETVTNSFVNIFPKNYRGKVFKTTRLIEDKLGSWLRGQIVLSFSIGFLTWIVLSLLGVSFALPLAVIAGILEIVPTIGPILSAIPAIIVALNISPLLALIVAVSYIFIQLFENNVLVPRIMQRAVGLNPIVIILSIIVGGKLLGVAGALLAIPFVSLIFVAYKNLE
jgi:predicted PurR-regulated permease PerM